MMLMMMMILFFPPGIEESAVEFVQLEKRREGEGDILQVMQDLISQINFSI